MSLADLLRRTSGADDDPGTDATPTVGAPTARRDGVTVPWFRAEREWTRPGNLTDGEST